LTFDLIDVTVIENKLVSDTAGMETSSTETYVEGASEMQTVGTQPKKTTRK